MNKQEKQNENQKFTILIVDDEVDNLALLQRTLRHDFLILKTTSPIEALDMLQVTPVDMIISDHKMDEMDGVEFLTRSCEFSPNAIRLLVTAYSDSKILIDAINYGKIYRYIKKPWEPSELLITVKGAFEYYQLKQENDQLIYDLKELFTGTINAIIEALDAKDSFTLGRSRRVTFLSLKVGEYLKLPAVEMGKLEVSGLLHDIGMIGISEDLINKTSLLSTDEFNAVKKHVDHGVKILDDIKQLRDVVSVIKSHHEHFDGSGYPDGLKGNEIPLNSKIISIADAYDSLVSNRSYRQGSSHDAALAQIKSQSGRQFDPLIVEAFCAIVDEAIEEIARVQAKVAEQA